MRRQLVVVLLSCLAGAQSLSLPGCYSLFALNEQLDASQFIDPDTLPNCFCDEHVGDTIVVNCLFGSVLANLTAALRAVAQSNGTLGRVHTSNLHFDEPLPDHYFAALGALPADISLTACPTDTKLAMGPRAFAGLEGRLVNLSISGCDTGGVPAALRNLRALRYLRLAANIAEMHGGDFDGLDALDTLDLADNYANVVGAQTFAGLASLRTLVLGPDNSFNESIFDALNNAPALDALFMSRVRLASVPDFAMDRMTTLTYLDLSYNNIENITMGSFSGLSNLQTLELQINLLKNIDDGSFEALANLRRLSLSANFIDQLTPDTFYGLGNLDNLQMEWNEFTTLPESAFAPLKSLQTLNLRRSERLSNMHPGAFYGLANLLALNLSRTNLTWLEPAALQPIPKLRHLDISESTIEYIPRDLFKHSAELEEFNAASTRLISLPAGLFDAAPRLKTLDLSDNRWICDCYLAPLIKYVYSKYETAVGANSDFYLAHAQDTTCHVPAELEGTPVTAVDTDTLDQWCPYEAPTEAPTQPPAPHTRRSTSAPEPARSPTTRATFAAQSTTTGALGEGAAWTAAGDGLVRVAIIAAVVGVGLVSAIVVAVVALRARRHGAVTDGKELSAVTTVR